MSAGETMRHPDGEPAGARHLRARARLRALQQQAEAQRSHDALTRRVEADRYPVAMLPHTAAPVVPLSSARREAFTRALAHELALAGDTAAAWPAAASAPRAGATSVHDAEREMTVVAAACTACRGACCSGGGDHAFLRAPVLAARLAAERRSASELAAQYTAHLPEQVIDGGCVFQAATGCTLPREIRAPICNRYQCRGLTSAVADVEASGRETGGSPQGGPAGLYVLHRQGTELSPGAFVPLPLT